MEAVIIPIGHDQSIRRYPWVTISIIALCTVMQIYSTFGAPNEDQLARELMQIAARHTPPDDGEEPTPEQLQEEARQIARETEALLNKRPEYRFGYRTDSGLSIKLFTSAFVHGGWLHLIGNMLFLWLAGSALEDRYGRLRFALFYLFGAAAASFAYGLTVHGAHLLVGASGAISACMGAFLVHFHKTEITFWYFWMYRSGTFRWPAWFALPLWLVEQFLYAFLYSSIGVVSQVAYAAHIGGFVAGMGAGFAMRKLFPEDAADDDVEYAPTPSPQIDAQLDDRIRRCLDAIQTRDLVTLRPLASRTILDLARIDHDGRILELYKTIVQQIGGIALTDGAYAAVATAADRLDDRHTFRVAAGAMMNDHPGSPQLPKVMWRLVQLHREAGEYELEQEMLRTLAQRFPRDPLGQKAQLELDRQA